MITTKRGRLLAEFIKLSLGFAWLTVIFSLISAYSGLPTVPAVIRGLRDLWSDGTLSHDVQVSVARWMIGWASGALVGIVVGLLTGRIAGFRFTFESFIVLLRAIPFISLIPLSLRIFGLSESGKFFLVGWASAGACWVIVHQRSLEIPRELVWRAKSLGASRGVWLYRVLLPNSREGLLSALRTSLSLGLIVIAIAELSGVFERSPTIWWSGGLGYRLFRSTDISRDDLMLATVLTFAILGIAVDQAFVAVWTFSGQLSFKLRQRQIRVMVNEIRNWQLTPPQITSNPPNLIMRDLHASYGDRFVFAELSCDIPAGKTMTVVGPSGAGKTTLIRAIGKFTGGDLNLTGEVLIDDEPVSAPTPRIGVVFQNAPVFEHLTVWDNVAFGNRVRHNPERTEAKSRCLRLLSDFGLIEAVAQRAGTLSGGQRQRLALAMVLANEPEILLLDEPFGALDAITRRQLQEFYSRYVKNRVTAVFVTHDIEEALLIGDLVRVGIGPGSLMFDIDKSGKSPHNWELTPEFSALRIKLIQSLEVVAGISSTQAFRTPE